MATIQKALGLSMFVLFAACGEPPAPAADTPPSAEMGSLAFALTAVDAEQRQYRLRNASFDVHGYSYETYEYVDVQVSSEDDPDGEMLRARVLAGSYTITLENSDWYFERLTPSGYERVEQSVLLGRNYQYVYVDRGVTTDVVFRFGVDGNELDFLGGNLDIGVTVEHPEQMAQAD